MGRNSEIITNKRFRSNTEKLGDIAPGAVTVSTSRSHFLDWPFYFPLLLLLEIISKMGLFKE